jgi:hypothetical protein
MAWTEGKNVAFAITGGPPPKPAAARAIAAADGEFGDAARGALAMWVFFRPSMVAAGALARWLARRGKGGLGDRVKLSVAEVIALARSCPGLVHVVFQHAGTCVDIRPGWPYQVVDLRPSLKVAWERVRRWHMALYAVALTTLVSPLFGRMAPDRVGFRKVLFEDMCRGYCEYVFRFFQQHRAATSTR